MANTGVIGSDGSIVAAALESAGHHAQSLMLDEFGGDLGNHLGGLLYLIAIIGALITLASGGSYRYGLYLLVGPSLFFFLVSDSTRIKSSGAEWHFGSQDLPQDEVKAGESGLVEGDGSAGKVSMFFAGWDRIVSGAVQGAISLLHITDSGSDRDFMSKTDRYLMVFKAGTLDPKLHGFVQIAIVDKCSQYIWLKKQVNDPDLPQLTKDRLKAVLDNHIGQTVQMNMDDFPDIQLWLQTTFPGQPESQIAKFTCDDLWLLAVKAFKKIQAQNLVDMIVKTNIPPGLTEQQVRSRLLLKFGQIVGQTNVITEIASGGSQSEEQTYTTYLINELTARLLLNELSQLNPNLASLQVSHDSQLVDVGGRRFDEDTSRMFRILSRGEEYQAKGEVVIAAMTLPYIQGTVLFFLAAAFPFFAITLVLPGRHTAFLLWMGLWLWAKMWDLGMAVVMMIDNMLYALLPHGPPVTDAVLNDPGAALRAILEVDPSYSIHMYYNLLASCMLAVPVATGFLVHKGGGEVIDAVTSSFREFPSKFGNSMAAYGRSFNAQHFLGMQRKAEYNALQSNKFAVNASDANLMRAIRSSAFVGVLRQGAGIAKPLFDKSGKLGAVGQGLLGATMAAPESYLSAMGDHFGNYRDLQMQMRLEMLPYNASKSHFTYQTDPESGLPVRVRDDTAYENAGTAVALRYNSHDFRLPVPTGAMINAYNAGRTLGMRQMYDSIFENGARGVMKGR